MPTQQILSRLRFLTIVIAAGLSAFSSTRMPAATAAEYSSRATAAGVRGRLIILPGIRNTKFHLEGFARRSARLLPGFDIEIRPWGVPMLGLHNLRAHARNAATAAAVARELAAWRAAHPDDKLYLVGYSGGGGMAALIVSALPNDVRVDRLVLVAPALSRAFDVDKQLLPHVEDFVVNYASERDLQVGFGTKLFGTIDGQMIESAGYSGFDGAHARLIEWRWSDRDRRLGHRGNHVSYLGRRWQSAYLMPALDPNNDALRVSARWGAERVRLAADL